jgi:SAM-dependent methyltransferase
VTVERRLSFGEVASQYDRFRPSYPEALVDEVLSFAGVATGERVVEVGAGTGKATALFAARGAHVVAVEPSAEMASVLRARELPGVDVVEASFELWDARGETFPLVYSAQAWHWVSPEVRFPKARTVLADDGVLAVFWTRPRWSDVPVRDELEAVYRREAPELGADAGPMRPASVERTGMWGDWKREIADAGVFEPPERRLHEWTNRYTTDEYVALLGTHSDHIVLPASTRERLMRAIAGVLDSAGGGITLTYVTKLWLVRARG